MQADEIDYGTYLDGRFAAITHIRAFGPWEILSASQEATSVLLPVLLVVNDEAHTVTLCLYDNIDERDRDAAWVAELPPDGGASAGVLARLNPPPPTLSANKAKKMPESNNESDSLTQLGNT